MGRRRSCSPTCQAGSNSVEWGNPIPPTQPPAGKSLSRCGSRDYPLLRKPPRLNWRTGCRGRPTRWAQPGAPERLAWGPQRRPRAGGREAGAAFGMVRACGRWWGSQRVADLKGSSRVPVFSPCTSRSWERRPGPSEGCSEDPLRPLPSRGRGPELTSLGALSPLLHSISPPSRSFFLADPPLFSSPLFYSWPVNCFWYLPTLGGGEAVSYFKKQCQLQAPQLSCVFCLHIIAKTIAI